MSLHSHCRIIFYFTNKMMESSTTLLRPSIIAATTIAVECTVEFVYTLGGSKSIGGRRLN